MPEVAVSSVTSAIRAALAVGVASGFSLLPDSARAQEAAEEDSKVLDRVQVTGSRIKRTDIEGANPVTILQRDDILRAGIQDLGEVLQDLPMMSGSPQSTQRNNGGDGSVRVDLRGLGSRRTLLLVNGHRLPPGGDDLSTIPTVMVERIEILKDGASAIYGADAVAGVVNIITRRDYEGAEVELTYGEAFDEGGTNYTVNFITGGNTKRGNFVVGLSYQEQEAVFQDVYDEPYLNNAVTVYDPDEFHQYGFSGEPWTDMDGDGIAGWGTFGSSRIPYGRFDLRLWNPAATSWTICQGSAGGGSLTTDYGPRNPFPGGCGPGTYNFAPANYIQTPYTRTGFFYQSNYELFESVDLYLDAHFTNRKSSQQLAPLPYDSRFDPSYSTIEPGVAISKDNYYNPFGVDIVSWRRRMVEVGGRRFFQDLNQWQVVAGLTGEYGATWTWDISFNYAKFTNGQTEFGQFTGSRLALAMGPSFLDPATGEVVCGTPDAPISDCVSMNAFSNPDTNPITQDMVRYVQVPLNRRDDSTRQVVTAMTTGDLFNIPAGPVSAAFGVQHRRDNTVALRDSLEAAGQTTGFNAGGRAGAYEVDSIFAEFNIPILFAQKGADLLELGISGRWDDFSIFDSATTLQASLRWKPVSSLLLRATAGEVYREPNISELFAGVFESFPSASDPCSGAGGTPGGTPGSGECEDVPPTYFQGDPDVRVLEGGNPEVVPEEGDTFTVGLVWSPEFIPGFSMTLDWWKIEIDDAIGKPWAGAVLGGCFSGAIPSFCSQITRFGPETTFWGTIDFLDTTTQKVGTQGAEGLDFSFNYTLNSRIGLWNLNWWGTYNISREQLVLKDPDGNGVADGFIGDSVGLFEHRGVTGFETAFPEFRWRFDADWNLGDWGVSLSVEYIQGTTECGNFFADQRYLTMYCPDDAEIVSIDPADTYWGIPIIDRSWINTIDDVFYIDLVGRYNVPGWGTEISAGIQNLTDELPPFLLLGFNGTTDADTYRAFGRSWFLRLKHSF